MAIVAALVLAAAGQLLNLVDPIIFGMIIDGYALNPDNLQEHALVTGILFWLGASVAIAVVARVAKTFQDYYARLAVQTFGMQIFNDGLAQTLRLSYDETYGLPLPGPAEGRSQNATGHLTCGRRRSLTFS